MASWPVVRGKMTEMLLRTEGLCKNFGAVQACNNLSLEVVAGEVHALIGPNGAGKTTLLNLLSGDLMPDAGRIFFSGNEITRLPLYKRAPLGLARSYQITSIFPQLTVEENLLLAIQAHCGHSFRFWQKSGKDPQLRASLAPALAQVGLDERAKIKAAKLSHGEKKQLEVGMALACNPKLLLLDEPMAGMGPGGTVELSRLISKLKQHMTILLIEHDMKAIFSLADRITVLDYGEVIATGTPEHIKTNPSVRQAYLGDEVQ
jgi:branched-chain amino acid transport system ATP-binding protein